MNYNIELIDQRNKPRQASSRHLITGFAMTGVGAFTFLLGTTNWIQTVYHAPIVSAYLLGSIGLLYGLFLLLLTFMRNKWLQQSSNNKAIRICSIVITALLAILFACSQWWLAAGISGLSAVTNLFAYFYDQKIAQALFVVFDEQNIILPASSRRKLLAWTEVERVTLRHGTITIDCTNNFLYQWTVKYNNLDAASFEAFCSAMIEANRSKRDAEDW